ncbi:superoxide dismutase [Ni] [Persephonella sp.]
MKKILFVPFMFLFILTVRDASAHCEIPCGIYDDRTRFNLLMEHIDTMEKSIKKIRELSGKTDPHSQNQFVRWITNKEKHARKFQHIVWEYFMTQRVKPARSSDSDRYSTYLKKIELLHKMLFYAMKVKQNVDTKYTSELRKLVKLFEDLYYAGHGHKH